jgi:hypothetical protein
MSVGPASTKCVGLLGQRTAASVAAMPNPSSHRACAGTVTPRLVVTEMTLK